MIAFTSTLFSAGDNGPKFSSLRIRRDAVRSSAIVAALSLSVARVEFDRGRDCIRQRVQIDRLFQAYIRRPGKRNDAFIVAGCEDQRDVARPDLLRQFEYQLAVKIYIQHRA